LEFLASGLSFYYLTAGHLTILSPTTTITTDYNSFGLAHPAMSNENYGFSLHVTVHVSPKDSEAFLAALKPVYELVAAEPECTYFEVFHSKDEPGVFHWIENYTQTKEWFMQV